MTFETIFKRLPVTDGGVVFELLESGDLYAITKEHVQLNLLRGTPLEGSVNNLYLRVQNSDGVFFTKLLGLDSKSRFSIQDKQAIYEGSFQDYTYRVVLSVFKQTWFYDVCLQGGSSASKASVFYGQDVGISDVNSIKNNEAYTCQYIDHKVFEGEKGFTIISRQNQGSPHVLQQGSLSQTVGYSTDAFQFFGLEYKRTNKPKALREGTLENSIYQYEYAYIALQSETFEGTMAETITFYGHYSDHIDEVATGVRDEALIHQLHETVRWPHDTKGSRLTLTQDFQQLVHGEDIHDEALMLRYPHRRHEEWDGQTRLSFFTDNAAHVVLNHKEMVVERPHGNIIITGDNEDFAKPLLSATHYMFGVFNAHIAFGNPVFHKLTSNIRSPLNTVKLSGQRLLIKLGEVYHLLGMPSLFEMGLNYSKWLYILKDDTLTITVTQAYKTPQLTFHFTSEQQISYDLMLLNHVVMGVHESEHALDVEATKQDILFKTAPSAFAHQHHPDLAFKMVSDKPFEFSDDHKFFADQQPRHTPLVCLNYQGVSTLTLSTQATLDGHFSPRINTPIEEQISDYTQQYHQRLNYFKLDHPEAPRELAQLNDLALWYMQNAMIHYASPHGLEQFSGGAWGTRDVCQGPCEFFLATQRFDVVRNILIKLYSHQFEHNGDWPQWFMYDAYANIQAHESHGDIVVWPLRTLALYLEATKDFSILYEHIPYRDIQTGKPTTKGAHVLDRVRKQLRYIESEAIQDTALTSYGGGDWDDTLQPANQDLKKRMVSGWTIALTYEAFTRFAQTIKDEQPILAANLMSWSDRIERDYRQHIIQEGVPAGFVVFEQGKAIPLIHPNDQKTGLTLRLLPLNRGIISNLFNDKETARYLELIEQHLKYPDGVRLMNHTVPYKGGKNTFFTRAETAANFGREISLQYVHAHIRYVEALAKTGREDAFEQLNVINPINLYERFTHASRRQNNAYFSSSDAAFATRYEAMEKFDHLKTGHVNVKGGWRVYSSGPGIFLNQLITNILGLKIKDNTLFLDPVLPTTLDGLVFHTMVQGKRVNLCYHLNKTPHDGFIRVMHQDKALLVKRASDQNKGVYVSLDDLNHPQDTVLTLDVYID